MRNKKIYNDGYVYVCTRISSPDFAARNPQKQQDLNKIYKLAYKEASRRDRDLEHAESIGRSLSLKIKTPMYEKVKTTNMVMIGNVLYSIINIDYDRGKGEMYFYLEEAKRFVK